MCVYFSKHLCAILLLLLLLLLLLSMLFLIFADEEILSRHYFKQRLNPLPLRSIKLIPSEIVSFFVLMEFYSTFR
jgi:Na+/serine symporter